MMQQRRLGKSGLLVSLLGLGCTAFNERIGVDAARGVVDKALELGINFFDTADVYGNFGGSEEALGEILGDRRKDVVLATKFGVSMDPAEPRRNVSRRYIMSAVEASLRRLKTDWIDLYQLHRPDDVTPIEETLRALDDLVRQGKVRYIGCSNLHAWRVVEAMWTSTHLGLESFVTCQDEYNALSREPERELLPAAARYGLGLLPWYPLASGLLTGKYRRGAPLPVDGRLTNNKRVAERYFTATRWEAVEQLRSFCESRNRSMVELAFGWLSATPHVSSIIAGATGPEQVAANASALSWRLTADEKAAIDAITAGL